ncbi:hypothetical protein V7128_16920 [Neobacillus vireti]|uniref:hypothetical protein n=1 Tax=Neobacillus vireti TaxID=220686 RepID=UPI002FFE0CA3
MSTVYADLAVKTFESGEAVAGVVFKYRKTAGENDTFYNYETFKIASLYSEIEKSKFRYLIKVIHQIIEELPAETEAVVIRSSAKQMSQYRRLNKLLSDAPVKVIPLYYQRLEAIEADTFILCEDAAERREDCIVEV